MRYMQNDCVGCPQGCISCGRRRDYLVIECDECGIWNEVMYEYEGKDYCESCLFEAWLKLNEAEPELQAWLKEWEPDTDNLPESYKRAWYEFKLECRIEEDDRS